MKVFVVVQGCYSSQWIAGVYASVEAAIADNPARELSADWQPRHASAERPGGWQYDGARWSNGLDWDEGCDIEEFDLIHLNETDPASVVKAIAAVQAQARISAGDPK